MMENDKLAGKLDDCPFIIGLQCNQRKHLCDKGKFEIHCLMNAMRQVGISVEANHEVLINEGILRACHVLLNRCFIKKFFVDKHNLSSSKLSDIVLAEINEAKSKGLEWHEIGWEFCRIPDVDEKGDDR